MKRTALLTLVLALLLTLGATLTAQAQTDQGRFWYESTIWSDCAGELIDLSGYLHVTFRMTFDNAGGVHVKFQANPQGITGVGQTTGNVYRGTGVSQDAFNATVGEQYTVINNFRIVGREPGTSMMVHSVWHYTINANGTLTATVDQSSSECR